MSRFHIVRTSIVAALLIGLAGAAWKTYRDPEFWFTADQRGDREFRAGRYDEAAKTYRDPTRRGTALYRAGKFEEAAAALAGSASPEAAFDRGNALVMLGKYGDAIAAYDRAIGLRTGWRECEENRAIAVIRRDRLQTHGGDETGGQIAPDEIVFDKNAKSKTDQTTEIAGGEPLDDAALRGLWLRRVQTKPADFLRAKFAFQVSADEAKTP